MDGNNDNNAFLEGFKEEDRGFIQEQGFSSNDELVAALKSMVSLPGENATEEDINAFYNKLGRPESADKYDFHIKEGNNDVFAKEVAPLLYKAGISQKQLDVLAPQWDALVEQSKEKVAKQLEEEDNQAKDLLRKEWGADYDKNIELAKRAAQSAGFQPEEIDQMVAAKGSAWVYKTMSKFGKLIGDADIKGAEGGQSANPKDPKTAAAEIEKLMKDREFANKVANMDPEALKKWNELNDIAFGRLQ